MRNILLSITLFSSIASKAQLITDSVNTVVKSAPHHTYKPLLTLSRQDIERLPATNFMELVNGAFPFISAEPLAASDYSFLVNGAITINPNAINISQIAEIRFYPLGTDAVTGALVKRGTFVIRTIDDNDGFLFNSTAGITFKGKVSAATSFGSSQTIEPTLYAHNEATYNLKKSSFQLSSALSYTSYPQPASVEKSANYLRDIDYSGNRLRLSNFLAVSLTEHLQLKGALYGVRQTAGYTSLIEGFSSGTQEYDATTTAYGANAGLEYSKGRFRNEFLVEAVAYRQSRNGKADYPNLSSYRAEDYMKAGASEIAISNRLQYTLLNQPGLSLQASLLARYQRTKDTVLQSFSRFNGTNQTGFSMASYTRTTRLWEAVPSLSLSYQQWLYAQAGVVYEDYQTFRSPLRYETTLSPRLGLQLSGARWLSKGGFFSSLLLSSNYTQLMLNDRYEDFLEGQISIIQNPNSGRLVFYDQQPVSKSPQWLHSLQAGMLNDRLGIELSYKTGIDAANVVYEILVPGGPSGLLGFSSYDRRSLSLALKAMLIQKESFSWRLHGILFRDEYKFREASPGNANQNITTVYDSEKPLWQGGLQTVVKLNAFTLQANGLLFFNRPNGSSFGQHTYRDTHTLNFFTAGYTLRFPKAVLSSLDITVQGRNLLQSGAPYTLAYQHKYAGLCLLARF